MTAAKNGVYSWAKKALPSCKRRAEVLSSCNDIKILWRSTGAYRVRYAPTHNERIEAKLSAILWAVTNFEENGEYCCTKVGNISQYRNYDVVSPFAYSLGGKKALGIEPDNQCPFFP